MLMRPLTNNDQPTLINFLRPFAESSLFILNNQAKRGLTPSTAQYAGHYFGLFHAQTLKAVIVQYWNGIVMSQGSADDVSALWDEHSPSFKHIKGFVGPANLCDTLQEKYHATQTPCPTLSLAAEERLYKLNLTKMVTPTQTQQTEFNCRLATDSDIDTLLPWAEQYKAEALNTPPDPAKRQQHLEEIKATIADSNLFLLCEENTPVSMAARTAQFQHLVQIGSVWTPPSLRKKGYGRGVVYGALKICATQGAKNAVLFTENQNIPAQRAYEALGFEHCGAFGIYLYQD